MNKLMVLGLILASISSYSQFVPIPTPPVDPSGGGSSKDVKELKEAFNTLTNSLDEVAYTGDYNDLTNTPVIPSIDYIDTHDWAWSSITNPPTKLSEFDNDEGFVDSSIINGLATESYVDNHKWSKNSITNLSDKISQFENDADYVTRTWINNPTNAVNTQTYSGYLVNAFNLMNWGAAKDSTTTYLKLGNADPLYGLMNKNFSRGYIELFSRPNDSYKLIQISPLGIRWLTTTPAIYNAPTDTYKWDWPSAKKGKLSLISDIDDRVKDLATTNYVDESLMDTAVITTNSFVDPYTKVVSLSNKEDGSIVSWVFNTNGAPYNIEIAGDKFEMYSAATADRIHISMTNNLVNVEQLSLYPTFDQVSNIVDTVINRMIDEGGIIRNGTNYVLVIDTSK